MANFKTHLTIATVGSSAAALLLIEKNWIDWSSVPWLIFIGAMGGLLPDIDSDNSKQVKIVFLLLALITTFTLLSDPHLSAEISRLFPTKQTICLTEKNNPFDFLYSLTGKCLAYSLLLCSLSIFIAIRFLLFYLFTRLTVHRGVFHSLLAAIFFILLATNINYHLFQHSAFFAWLGGLFIGLGFIIHLILDEIYSVDLANSRLKRSFGTALKLYNYRSGYASITMLLGTLLLYSIIPSVSL